MKQHSLRLVSLIGFACAAIVPMGTTLVKSPAAIAQNDNCYMVTSSGRVVSLGNLCGNKPVQPAPSSTPKTSPAAAPNNASSNVFQAKIKYRLGKTPVIDVTFNGKKTFEMIVDTGADGTLITGAMARSLGLPVTGIGQFEMADGRLVSMPLSRVQSISVNGAVVRNVEVAIADKTDVGLLGHDFFDNYDIKIKQNVVEFYKR